MAIILKCTTTYTMLQHKQRNVTICQRCNSPTDFRCKVFMHENSKSAGKGGDMVRSELHLSY